MLEVVKYVLLKGKISLGENLEGVVLELSEYIYMRMLNENFRVKHWDDYILKSYRRGLANWLKMTKSEIIDTKGNYELLKSFQDISTSRKQESNDFQKISDRIYLTEIPKIIDNLISESRYTFTEHEVANIKISILLSFLDNKFYSFYLQDEVIRDYTRFLYNYLKQSIIQNIRSEAAYSNLDIQQDIIYNKDNKDFENL